MSDDLKTKRATKAEGRRFIFAPKIEELGARVKAAEDAAEEARSLFEDLADSEDLLERLAALLMAVRNLASGILTADELQVEADKVLDGVRDQFPEWLREELGRRS